MQLPKILLPKFTTTIPSTGELIKFRPFTNGEEKILLIANESDDIADAFNATKDLIDACYENIDSNKLASYDIDFLFLQLIIQSVSNISELYFRSMKCNKTDGECDKTIKLKINLEDITVQQYDEDSEKYLAYKPQTHKNGGVSFSITDTLGIVIKHPGFEEQTKYAKLETQTESELIKLCIVSIYDDESVFTKNDFNQAELDEFYASIPSKQLQELQKFIRNTPRVRYETEFVCKECGFREPLKFEDFQSFFL